VTTPANEPWVWIDKVVILAVHDEQLAEHGGRGGLRDNGLLESALARPQQLAAYGEPDVADLAAAYAVGLAKNHAFVDGNKRTAFVALELFLALNGSTLLADDADCVLTMLSVAAGDLDERGLADWIRDRSSAR
jgi:death on curing protein